MLFLMDIVVQYACIWALQPYQATLFLYPLKTSENFSFYTPWKYQKTRGFLMFLEGIEWEIL